MGCAHDAGRFVDESEAQVATAATTHRITAIGIVLFIRLAPRADTEGADGPLVIPMRLNILSRVLFRLTEVSDVMRILYSIRQTEPIRRSERHFDPDVRFLKDNS